MIAKTRQKRQCLMQDLIGILEFSIHKWQTRLDLGK